MEDHIKLDNSTREQFTFRNNYETDKMESPKSLVQISHHTTLSNLHSELYLTVQLII